MHSFSYQNNQLHCESVSVASLIEKYGTPLYVYSANTFRDHYRRLDQSLSEIDHHLCYAVKANSNIAILNLLAQEGSGFDIVSGGELQRVLKAGGKAQDCTFAGVGKTSEEIALALQKKIYAFNVESPAELEQINSIASGLKKRAPVAIRVNPDIEASTHRYISTGKKENKFGIDFDQIEKIYARAAKMPSIELRGVQMHIGSQLTKIQPYVQAVKKMTPLVAHLRDLYDLEFFSIGGGIGIIYEDTLESGAESWWKKHSQKNRLLTIEKYTEKLLPLLQKLGMRILLEPGRYIAGNAGILATTVLYQKNGSAKKFLIVDAGMNDLIRPALYQGHHDIIPLTQSANRRRNANYDVVGPICESGDFFAQGRKLPAIKAGEPIALMSAGAYGFTMASNYNSRPFPAEILVDGVKAHCIRRRQNFADLVRGESIAS